MKVFLLFFLIISTLFANTTSKIKTTKKKLSEVAKKEKVILSSLDSISKNITKYQKEVDKIRNSISTLSNEIQNSKSKALRAQKKLKKIQKIISTLNSKKDSVNKKLVEILSKEIQLNILKNSNSLNSNIDDLINSYINKTYSKVLRDKFNKTKLKSLSLKLDLAYAKSEYDKINSKVKALLDKKQKLKDYQKLRQTTLKKLETEKKSYIKKLQKIRKENRTLTKVLRKLNILKQKDEEKRNSIVITSHDNNKVAVRRVGSGYNKTPVSSYHGPKTIAPFKRYKVVRKFGSFTDPNYHIKMFNPNVVLKPIGSKNVINVLDGKVISITNTPPIGNIVIIQNKNGLHTLYAKLSTVASTIKRGYHVKKGYVLGKVKDELFFEVTKNNTNINPLKLIK